jgi:hypothetical protein
VNGLQQGRWRGGVSQAEHPAAGVRGKRSAAFSTLDCAGPVVRADPGRQAQQQLLMLWLCVYTRTNVCALCSLGC